MLEQTVAFVASMMVLLDMKQTASAKGSHGAAKGTQDIN
jgi:hypothetical protein